jgi:DNA (cytosine-5)-methyltransferase 1
MNYLSVCSGIEAATVAWHHMGWKPVGFSEIEKFPSEVLAHHYPTVTNFGDMTKYKDWNINDSVGLLVGGTPCQSFSVAGLRKGLEDPRGNLALTYVGILDRFRPKWCIWENVPGVLSSGGGRDFGSFLGALVELGYGWAYRVLDAQNFGVAQRRRRVFVVGCFRDWRPAAEILFESESLSGDIKKVRKKRQTPSGVTTNRLVAFGEYSDDGTASTIKARDYKDATDLIVIDRAAFNNGKNALYTPYIEHTETMPTLISKGPHAIMNNMVIRRLTEIECERLQGFPDNYTNINENCPSGPRYKALGNSMAVPVMRWIGERINQYERP